MVVHVGDIVATTIENRSGEIAVNVTKNNAFWMTLKSKNKIKTFSGGRVIFQELSYQENDTFMYYNGYDFLSVKPSNVHDAAQYAIKQATAAVTISGLEELQNSGDEEFIDLLDTRMDVAESTMANNLTAGTYSNGDNPLSINGLQQQVSKDPTAGRVGNIPREDNMFWRNQAFPGMTGANLEHLMRRAWLGTKRGRDKTDIITCDNNTYELYESSMREDRRFMNRKMADAGFENVTFKSTPVVFDESCPENTMYMLNCKFIMLRPHSKRNMVPSRKKEAINQDATIQHILWAGNMTMSNPHLQAVIYGPGTPTQAA